jgi:hypothetical protein
MHFFSSIKTSARGGKQNEIHDRRNDIEGAATSTYHYQKAVAQYFEQSGPLQSCHPRPEIVALLGGPLLLELQPQGLKSIHLL